MPFFMLYFHAVFSYQYSTLVDVSLGGPVVTSGPGLGIGMGMATRNRKVKSKPGYLTAAVSNQGVLQAQLKTPLQLVKQQLTGTIHPSTTPSAANVTTGTSYYI